MSFRRLVFAIFFTTVLWAQEPTSNSSLKPDQEPSAISKPDPAAMQTASPSQLPPPARDDLAQMRLDLDHMESLLNNMNSEITFLRDQNLQILLNTNSRMWAMLIRDLRLQINHEEQHRASAPEAPRKNTGNPQSPTNRPK